MSLTIKNCLYYVLNNKGNGGRFVQGDIYIKNGIIKELGKGLQKMGRVIDADGKRVIPGVIDAHAHFREPGMTDAEDWRTGSMAAAAGGETTVLVMPNTNPPIITLEELERNRAYASKSLVNYGFHFGASNDNLQEIKKVTGVASIKVFMGASTGTLLIDNPDVLYEIFSNLEDKLVAVHAEHNGLIKHHSDRFKSQKAPYHHEVRPAVCEAEAIKKAIELAQETGCKLHVLHVSTESGLKYIKEAKKRGVQVTCEVTPHHLFLTAERHYNSLGNYGKMNPPLRPEKDQQALWQGIKDGTIDIIATDHAPHLRSEKDKPYWEAPAGVPGVETMLPLLLNAMLNRKIDFSRLVAMTSYNPAKIYGLANKGLIEVGYDADLVIIDLNLERIVRNEELRTKCGWSPFNGWKLKGWPVTTIVNGQIAYHNGEIFDDVRGREVSYIIK